MASFTVTTAPWVAGTLVSAYPNEAWVDPPRIPSGPSVASGTVTSSGTVAFTDLVADRTYVAYALGTGVRFTTSTSGLQDPIAKPDRERLRELELASGGGGGGTGGVGHEIQDEGTPLTQRDALNFTGAGVTVTDGGTETVVSVPGSSVSTILYDDVLGAWPDRPSADETVSYIWIGPTFPDVGGATGFVSNVDVFIPNAEVVGGGGASLTWTKATLGTNVTHLQDSDPSGYYYVQYARDGDQLHLRGVAALAGGATTILTLPNVTPRVRPLSYQSRSVPGAGGQRAVTFAPTGTVTIDTSVAYVYLECSIWLDVDPTV